MLGKKHVTIFGQRQDRDRFFGLGDFRGEETKILGGEAFENTRENAESARAALRGLQGKCGFRFGQALQHGAKVFEIGVTLRKRTRGGSDNIFRSAAQFFSGLAEQKKILTGGAFRAATADKLDTPILTNPGAAPHQNQADLAGALDVSAAARLQIGGFDFDGAQDALAVDFLANAEFRQLIRGAVADRDSAVFKNNLICCALGAFEDFIRRLRAAQIYGANLGSEMEGNRGASEALLKHGREQVLASVLLHVVETARPVD